jgi:hypothetical protein
MLTLALCAGCGNANHDLLSVEKDSAPSLTLLVNGTQTPTRVTLQGYVQLTVQSSGFTQTPQITISDNGQPVVYEWSADQAAPGWWVDSLDNGNHTLVATTFQGSAQTATSRPVQLTVLINGGSLASTAPFTANSNVQSLFGMLGRELVAAGYRVPPTSTGSVDNWETMVAQLDGSGVVAGNAATGSNAFNSVTLNEWLDTAGAGYQMIQGRGKDIFVSISPSLAGKVNLYGWHAIYVDAAGLDDEARGIYHANNDSIDRDFLVTGYQTRPARGRDVWVARYDYQGNLAWQDTYDGGSGDDEGAAVDCDYVAGYVTLTHASRRRPPVPIPDVPVIPEPLPRPQSGSIDKDIFVRAYDDAGNIRWTTTIDGEAHLDDVANGAAFVHDQPGWNELYVCGSEQLSAEESAIVLIKIDSSTGKVIWKQTSHPSLINFGSGMVGGLDEATGCVVDWRGSIYVHGTQDKTNAVNNTRAITQRWSRDGKLLWQSVAQGTESGKGITLDKDGYVTVGAQLPATVSTAVSSQIIRYLP